MLTQRKIKIRKQGQELHIAFEGNSLIQQAKTEVEQAQTETTELDLAQQNEAKITPNEVTFANLALLDALSTRLGTKKHNNIFEVFSSATVRPGKISLNVIEEGSKKKICNGYNIPKKHQRFFPGQQHYTLQTKGLCTDNTNTFAVLHDHPIDDHSIQQLTNYVNTQLQKITEEEQETLSSDIETIEQYNQQHKSQAAVPIEAGVITLHAKPADINTQKIKLPAKQETKENTGYINFAEAAAQQQAKDQIQENNTPKTANENLNVLYHKMNDTQSNKSLGEVLAVIEKHHSPLKQTQENYNNAKSLYQGQKWLSLNFFSKMSYGLQTLYYSSSRDQLTKLNMLELLKSTLEKTTEVSQLALSIANIEKVAKDAFQHGVNGITTSNPQSRTNDGAVKALMTSTSSYFWGRSFKQDLEKPVLEHSSKGTLKSIARTSMSASAGA